VAGFRGTIVPVYDLAALMGLAVAARPRWLVIAAETGAALAFAGFDGHRRVLRDAIVPADPALATRRLVRALLPVDGLARPIIHLPSVFEFVRQLLPAADHGKET
jgi:purine-binding chemotaxis protein CheW